MILTCNLYMNIVSTSFFAKKVYKDTFLIVFKIIYKSPLNLLELSFDSNILNIFN